MRKVLLFLGVIAALMVIGGSAWAWQQANKPHVYAGFVDPKPAPDFTLTDETGRAFQLSQLKGQWVLLNYGYTSCPDVCPTTLAELSKVKRLLKEEGLEVQIVFVSVDPERDTVEVMKQYTEHFQAGIKALTGTEQEVAAASEGYGVAYEKEESTSAVGYLVSHTAYVYLLDPEFNWHITYPFGISAAEIANDLIYLMEKEK